MLPSKARVSNPTITNKYVWGTMQLVQCGSKDQDQPRIGQAVNIGVRASESMETLKKTADIVELSSQGDSSVKVTAGVVEVNAASDSLADLLVKDNAASENARTSNEDDEDEEHWNTSTGARLDSWFRALTLTAKAAINTATSSLKKKKQKKDRYNESEARFTANKEAWDHYRRSFPKQFELIPTETTNFMCGLFALQHSIRSQVPNIPVPTLKQLADHLHSDEATRFIEATEASNLNDKSNFRGDQLAHALQEYGKTLGVNLRLGFMLKNTIWLYPIQDQDAQIVVWIWNNGAQDDRTGKLGHYEGLKPIQDFNHSTSSLDTAIHVDPDSEYVVTKHNVDSTTEVQLVEIFNNAINDNNKLLKKSKGINVAKISEDLVMKGGVKVQAAEAANMRFALENGIRVPKVHRDFTHEGRYYIIMDFVRGRSLEELWNRMPEKTRDAYTRKAKYIFHRLQSHPVRNMPLGPVGGTNGKPWRSPWFGRNGAGPFDNVLEMYDWFDQHKHMRETLMRGQLTGEHEEGAKPGVSVRPKSRNRYFYELVLTHGDFRRRNFILEDTEDEPEQTEKGFLDTNKKMTLISWSYGGVFPKRLELLGMMRADIENQDEADFQIDVVGWWLCRLLIFEIWK